MAVGTGRGEREVWASMSTWENKRVRHQDVECRGTHFMLTHSRTWMRRPAFYLGPPQNSAGALYTCNCTPTPQQNCSHYPSRQLQYCQGFSAWNLPPAAHLGLSQGLRSPGTCPDVQHCTLPLPPCNSRTETVREQSPH